MSDNLKREDLVDLASFLAGVKGQLEDLNKKVIEGSNLRPHSIDVAKVAREFDQKAGLVSNVTQPIAPQAIHQPQLVPQFQAELDPNQLTFAFDKKHTLDDIFNKIDDTYRKVINLEEEVRELRNTLEEKKSLLK